VLVRLVQFVSVMLYFLVAGVMWGTWLSLGRTMTRYDAGTFLADGKHMIDNLATVMAVLMISAIVVGLVAVVLLFRQGYRAAGCLALVALVLMAGVLVVTLAVEVPIDNRIKTWTTDTLPGDWLDIRARWAAFHTLRTFLSVAGLAAAVAAALAIRPAERARVPAGR
jgi:anthrone oxygenase-like protein